MIQYLTDNLLQKSTILITLGRLKTLLLFTLSYLGIAVVLSACGQKGALYLPDDTQNNSSDTSLDSGNRQAQKVSNTTNTEAQMINTDNNSQVDAKDDY